MWLLLGCLPSVVSNQFVSAPEPPKSPSTFPRNGIWVSVENPLKNNVNCVPEMLTKSRLWSYGWTLNFSKNQKSRLETHPRKDVGKSCPRRPDPAPQNSEKYRLVYTKPWFPAFQLWCNMAGKVFPSPPIWDTLATKAQKNTSQDSSKNQRNTHCRKLKILMEMGSFWDSLFHSISIFLHFVRTRASLHHRSEAQIRKKWKEDTQQVTKWTYKLHNVHNWIHNFAN